MSDREIFKKVPLSEKKNIFKSVISERIEMVAKGDSDSVLYFLPKSMIEKKDIDKDQMEVTLAKHSDPVVKNEMIIVNFSFQGDRYFFHTNISSNSGQIILEPIKDLYILQRRKSPRLEIPDDYTGLINISMHNAKPVFFETRILDFGTGGCRVLYNRDVPFFKTGENFRGFLKIGNKSPFEIDCQVKHTFSNSNSATLPQVFGVQFINLTSIDENRLLVIFMDLQRALFLKSGNRF